MSKSNKAYKYKLHPTTEQCVLFAKIFGCCRKVYNEMLAYNNSLYANTGKKLSKTAANNYCNRELKKKYPYLREADKFALTNSIYALYNGYDRFFKKLANFPKFKSKHASRKSYTTNFTNNNIVVTDNCVKLPKVGFVDAKIHRTAPDGWKIKSATVSQEGDGKYYVSVLFEYNAEITESCDPSNAIGFDYKVSELYADSNGNFGGMPKFAKKSVKRLAKAQRNLSRKVKGSNNYKKQKRKVNKIHKSIANQRKDFLHKKSFAIAKQYDCICIQDERIKEKAQFRPYHAYRRSVYDCGWYSFTQMLAYKQADRGHKLIVVDKDFPSTQTCSICGHINAELAGNDEIRKWECPCCHVIHDRDVNAAINILHEGLKQLA